MSRSLANATKEIVELYGTKDNTYDDFPVGTPVKIICLSQDFTFFYGETGKVIGNKKRYLGIRVEYDEPRHYTDGTIETGFNFAPDDLVILDDNVRAIAAERQRLEKIKKEEITKEEENMSRSARFEIMDL